MPTAGRLGASYLNDQTHFASYDVNYMPIFLREVVENCINNYDEFKNEFGYDTSKSIIVRENPYIKKELGISACNVKDEGKGINDEIYKNKFTLIGNKDKEKFGVGSRVNGCKSNRDGVFISSVYEDEEGELQIRFIHFFHTLIYKNTPFNKQETYLFTDPLTEYAPYCNNKDKHPVEWFLYHYSVSVKKWFDNLNVENRRTGTSVTFLGEIQECIQFDTTTYPTEFKESWFHSLNHRFEEVKYNIRVETKSIKDKPRDYTLWGYKKYLDSVKESKETYEVIDTVGTLFKVIDKSLDKPKLLYKLKLTALLAKKEDGGRLLSSQFLQFNFEKEGYTYQKPDRKPNYFKYKIEVPVTNNIRLGKTGHKYFCLMLEVIPEADVQLIPSTDRLSIVYKSNRNDILRDLDLKELGQFYDWNMSLEMEKALEKYQSSTEDIDQELFQHFLNKLKLNIKLPAKPVGKNKPDVWDSCEFACPYPRSTRDRNPKDKTPYPYGQLNESTIQNFLPDFIDEVSFKEKQTDDYTKELSQHILFTGTGIYINENSVVVKQVLTNFLKFSTKAKPRDPKTILKIAVATNIIDMVSYYKRANNWPEGSKLHLAICKLFEENAQLLDSLLMQQNPFSSYTIGLHLIKV